MPRIKRDLETALKHRVNAGRVAVKNQIGFFSAQFGEVSSDWKDDDTRVTFADFAISEKISAELRRCFPEDDFCTEEANPQDETINLGSRFAWVLDPVDGTNNYALGLANCGISLALLKHGIPVFGIIYDHSRQMLIQGGPDVGVYEGRQQTSPKSGSLDSQSMVGLHFPLGPGECARLGPLLCRYRVRSFGSASLILAYVATGKLDGCVDSKVYVWDIAAAYALCLAAGIEVIFMSGSPFPLQTFHPRMKPVRYYAGRHEFCQYVGELLGDDSPSPVG